MDRITVYRALVWIMGLVIIAAIGSLIDGFLHRSFNGVSFSAGWFQALLWAWWIFGRKPGTIPPPR